MQNKYEFLCEVGYSSNHNEDDNQTFMFDNYTNHPCKKKKNKSLENSRVNMNMTLSQILENISELHIKPMGTRHIENYLAIYKERF